MTSGERISRPCGGLFEGRQCSAVNRVTREGFSITKTLYRRDKTSLFPGRTFFQETHNLVSVGNSLFFRILPLPTPVQC